MPSSYLQTSDVYKATADEKRGYLGGRIYTVSACLIPEGDCLITFNFFDDTGDVLVGSYERVFTEADLAAIDASYPTLAGDFFSMTFAVAKDYLETENPGATFTPG